MAKLTKNSGFTLVELAVSLVVIGLLVGLGMTLVGPLMTAIKVRESKENLGAAVESLNSWASGNNRLPQWGDGVTDTTADEFVEVTRNTADAWGRPFIYLFDANLFNATPTKDTICGRRTTPISLTDSNTGTTIQNVAYIILSQGDNAATDSKIGATPVTSQSISSTTTVAANTTDDLVRWVTLDELRTKIGCQGAQLRIANNELPFANKGAAYPTIPLTPDGGVQFNPATTGIYEWCWSSTTSQTLSDLVFTCVAPSSSATIARTSSPTTCSLTTGTWQRCTSLNLFSAMLNGTTPPPGSYDISLFLRDGDGSLTQKTFVLTINPQ